MSYKYEYKNSQYAVLRNQTERIAVFAKSKFSYATEMVKWLNSTCGRTIGRKCECPDPTAMCAPIEPPELSEDEIEDIKNAANIKAIEILESIEFKDDQNEINAIEAVASYLLAEKRKEEQI